MSVIYGSNALGGIINLITATPKKKLSAGVRSYYESIGKYNFSGNASLNEGNHQLQLSMARNFFSPAGHLRTPSIVFNYGSLRTIYR
ncbi:hypothetical protein EMGBS15_18430 [Filimonas sp.]|nr:hypothetical protein EMGBS15_18430 [Filimonas sp.]